MSKAFRETFGDKKNITRAEMRAFLQGPPPPLDKDGNVQYVTEQAHKDRCNVQSIINRYAKTGLLEHVSTFEGDYGDMKGSDFKEMMDRVVSVNQKFQEFPSDIRKRFDHDPAKFLDFFDDPRNKDEALKMGLIRADWTLDSPKQEHRAQEAAEGKTEAKA